MRIQRCGPKWEVSGAEGAPQRSVRVYDHVVSLGCSRYLFALAVESMWYVALECAKERVHKS